MKTTPTKAQANQQARASIGAQNGEHAVRFDRVTPQPDGSFQHFYRGKPVAGPRAAAPVSGAAPVEDGTGTMDRGWLFHFFVGFFTNEWNKSFAAPPAPAPAEDPRPDKEST